MSARSPSIQAPAADARAADASSAAAGRSLPPLEEPEAAEGLLHLGDFTTDLRVLLLVAMAVVVGTLSVLSAWILLRLIALVTGIAYFGALTTTPPLIGSLHLAPWTIAVPVVGSIIVGFMARYGSEKIRGHGIPEAMEAILIGKSRLDPKVAILKPLSSAIAIGTGGPFGAEGPIIMTGGAIGSLLAQLFPVSSAERKTMLVAGASAGMTAVFGTPIAAILLAVELLLFEWKPRSFIPVAVASTIAAAERGLLLPAAPLFPFTAHVAVSVPHFGGWVLMGLLTGLGSGLLTALVYAAEDGFMKLPIHWMWWPAIGGVVVGVGGLIEPHALGVGYDNIAHLLAGSMVTKAVLLLLVVKAVIWSVALGSGTSGGVLAPLLIMGGALGSLVGGFMPPAGVGFWALLGMASIMGGTMRAPLTSTLFAVELTHDVGMLLPVFTACTASYALTVLILKRSILTEKVARRGHHLSREYHVDPFDLTRVADVMVRKVDSLLGTMPVDKAVALFGSHEAQHKSYPVLDADGRVIGMVSRSDILRWRREGAHGAATLAEMVAGHEVMLGYPDEMTGALIDRMVTSEMGRVPVVSRADRRLVGLVARRDLLQVRARLTADEQLRQSFFAWRPGRKRPGGTTEG